LWASSVYEAQLTLKDPSHVSLYAMWKGLLCIPWLPWKDKIMEVNKHIFKLFTMRLEPKTPSNLMLCDNISDSQFMKSLS